MAPPLHKCFCPPVTNTALESTTSLSGKKTKQEADQLVGPYATLPHSTWQSMIYPIWMSLVVILRQTVAELFDSTPSWLFLCISIQYLVTFYSLAEAACDVLSGLVVEVVGLGVRVKFDCDIHPDHLWQWTMDCWTCDNGRFHPKFAGRDPRRCVRHIWHSLCIACCPFKTQRRSWTTVHRRLLSSSNHWLQTGWKLSGFYWCLHSILCILLQYTYTVSNSLIVLDFCFSSPGKRWANIFVNATKTTKFS